MKAVLSLDRVRILYGDRVAVDGLTLDVRGGEIVGLLGPNGSGKSSTLNAVGGMLAPASGTVRLLGLCPRKDAVAAKRLLGLVPQELAVYEDLSIGRNVEFFGRLYGLRGHALKSRCRDVLAFVALDGMESRTVRTLSGGMQRRLNLACALLHRPKLLLLDEPTVGLDIQSRDAIFAGVRALRDEGCAVVFTTHHMEEVELLCDRIAIMGRGKLLGLGTLGELAASLSAEKKVARFDGPHHAKAPHSRLERIYLELTGPQAGRSEPAARASR